MNVVNGNLVLLIPVVVSPFELMQPLRWEEPRDGLMKVPVAFFPAHFPFDNNEKTR